jgi:hypothetical protein
MGGSRVYTYAKHRISGSWVTIQVQELQKSQATLASFRGSLSSKGDGRTPYNHKNPFQSGPLLDAGPIICGA